MKLSVMLTMSLSASLYESYARLYDEYSTSLFTFDDMIAHLGLGLQSGLKRASLLSARGYLTLFGRLGRKRLYRLLSPEQALFAHLHMKNLVELRQQRYAHLIIDAGMQLSRSREVGLVGVWLFGSVARGEARNDSDVDLMVVTKYLTGNRNEMVKRIFSSLDLARERQFLFENGVMTDLSIYPLAERELSSFYPIMLDVLDHGIVLFERDKILTQTAESMKLAASRLGVRRIQLGSHWMWVLPPGLEVGEPLEVREAI
jgi:predicted nucleotidyltransferase